MAGTPFLTARRAPARSAAVTISVSTLAAPSTWGVAVVVAAAALPALEARSAAAAAVEAAGNAGERFVCIHVHALQIQSCIEVLFVMQIHERGPS
jgi:Na+/serine symporter